MQYACSLQNYTQPRYLIAMIEMRFMVELKCTQKAKPKSTRIVSTEFYA